MDQTQNLRIFLDMRAKPKTGIFRYAESLAERLSAFFPDFDLIPWKDSFSSYQNNRISPLNAIFRLFYELFILPFKLKKENAVIFHCTKNFGVPVFSRCIKIVTVHDVIPIELKEYYHNCFTWFYYYCSFWLACRGSDLIVCISDFTRQRVLHFFPFAADKIRVVYLGCPAPDQGQTQNLKTDARSHLDEMGIRKPYILMIGGTEPRKNVIFAAEAYISGAACHDHDLVIAGDEWRGYPFPDRIRNHPQIHCLGKIIDSDLNFLYANADVFVFPSLYEGFGLPPFEAMSRGIPVVAANASCLPELLNGCALLFKPGDSKDFLDKLDLMLHSDEIRRKYIAVGMDKARQMTWDKTAEATAHIYRNLIDGRNNS